MLHCCLWFIVRVQLHLSHSSCCVKHSLSSKHHDKCVVSWMQAAGDLAGPKDMIKSSLDTFEQLALNSQDSRAMVLFNLAKRLLQPTAEERADAKDVLLELQALAAHL